MHAQSQKMRSFPLNHPHYDITSFCPNARNYDTGLPIF